MNYDKLRDDILNHLAAKNNLSPEQIRQNHNIDEIEYNKILKSLYNEQMLKSEIPFPGGEEFAIQYPRISERAEDFLNTGGYTARRKWETKQHIRKIIGNIFKYSVSVITIIIAIWQVVITDRTNRLEDRNDALQRRMDSLIEKQHEKPAIISLPDTTKKIRIDTAGKE